jgi:hypothetical protein
VQSVEPEPEPELEQLAGPVGVGGQRPVQELDRCGGAFLGQPGQRGGLGLSTRS